MTDLVAELSGGCYTDVPVGRERATSDRELGVRLELNVPRTQTNQPRDERRPTNRRNLALNRHEVHEAGVLETGHEPEHEVRPRRTRSNVEQDVGIVGRRQECSGSVQHDSAD